MKTNDMSAETVTVADSQKAEILAYMRAGNRITGMEALDKFGCMTLAQRIWDLKMIDGVKGIRMEMVCKKTRRGTARVAEYWIEGAGGGGREQEAGSKKEENAAE